MSQRGDIALSPEPSVTVIEEPSVTVLAPKNAARARDLLYEELFFVDTGLVYDEESRKTLTESAEGELNKATRQIKATGIDPLELSAAIMAWPEVFPGATATASAIAKHLPRLRAGARGQVARSNGHDDVRTVADRVAAQMKQNEEEGVSWVP